MLVRTSFQTITNRTMEATRRQTNRLANLQLQASSGKRFAAVSDNPAQAISALASKAQLNRLDANHETILGAQSRLNLSVSTLQQIATVLTRSRSLALQAGDASNPPIAMESIASEVDQALSRVIELANTDVNGSYLFSGVSTDTQPFVVASRDNEGRPAHIKYQGADTQNQVRVSPTLDVATYYPGSEVFQSIERGPSVYQGGTGARAGTAIDSARGYGSLLVRHTSTTYAGGSGVTAGTGSTNGDNILGPAGSHSLAIVDTSGTGAFGTISLNGGPAVPFTNADTNLRIAGNRGDVVYVNTTAITANFNGTAAITSNGTLSTDGGLTSIPIDFSGNQAVTNSQTDGITHVDSTNIRAVGTDRIHYTGTTDVFQLLTALRDDLRNVHGLSQNEQIASVSSKVAEFDRIRNQVLEVVGAQSANLQTLDGLEEQVQNLKLAAQKMVSDLEETDLAEVVVQLQAQENMLQLTFGSFSRIMNESLLDYLR